MALICGAPECRSGRAADDAAPKAEDPFAGEPERPKAETPIRFLTSWDEARAEARGSGRRILAYFTGDHCGWCRVLEKRTFTDAEVVSLTREFVCVDVHIEKYPELADRFRIDSIPRSFVLTPEEQVVDHRIGYRPAAEYAEWLASARTRAPEPIAVGRESDPPPPAGEDEETADVVIWFVDATRSIERWGDPDRVGHAPLLRLLRASGHRPRVEHIARAALPDRWNRAEAEGRGPDLIAVDNLAGLVGELHRKGRLVDVYSERLTWTPEVAACSDFAAKLLFLVAGSHREASAREAISVILRPGPETEPPGIPLKAEHDREGAISVARAAAVAFVAGDPEGLKAVASTASPQLANCSVLNPCRRDRRVVAGPVEVRGNGVIAFARVEIRFEGKAAIGADPALVVLRREGAGWRAFAVSLDVLTLKTLPILCRLDLGVDAPSRDLPAPRLLHPSEGGPLGDRGRSFSWEIPDGGEPLAAQVCQVLWNDGGGTRWPETRWRVESGEPRSRSLPLAETNKDVTGVTAREMSWAVWSIGNSGSIASSDARRYRVEKP